MKTDTTVSELMYMNNEELLQIAKEFSFPYEWLNYDAYTFLEFCLTRIQSKNYLQTHNIKSFYWK